MMVFSIFSFDHKSPINLMGNIVVGLDDVVDGLWPCDHSKWRKSRLQFTFVVHCCLGCIQCDVVCVTVLTVSFWFLSLSQISHVFPSGIPMEIHYSSMSMCVVPWLWTALWFYIKYFSRSGNGFGLAECWTFMRVRNCRNVSDILKDNISTSPL